MSKSLPNTKLSILSSDFFFPSFSIFNIHNIGKYLRNGAIAIKLIKFQAFSYYHP
jgi:hypothetical protein